MSKKSFFILVTLNIIIIFLPINSVLAQSSSQKGNQITSPEVSIILEQIKQLREDMKKRFVQVDKRFEQVDKRFEQIDKRFEQVNKRFEDMNERFEFLQLLMLTILGVILGGTIYNIIRDRKVPKDIDLYIEKTRKTEIMVKELAAREPELMEHFKNIGVYS